MIQNIKILNQIPLLRQLFVQYFWFIIVSAIVLFYLYPHYKEVLNKGLNSSNYYPPWNSSARPSWFLIVSDLHLGTVRPNSYEKVFLPLNFGIKTYHPQKIIIPGDLTDNYDGHRLYPYRRQMSEDWDLYKTLLQNLNITKDQVIQVRGNHDVFKIANFSSPRHYGQELFRYHNESEFHFQIFSIKTESGLLKFVLIHPYRFPIGPICFTAVDAFPTNAYYDRLNSILQANDSDITFLITHYPAIAFSPSTKIQEIYQKSPNQRIVISGHWHKRKNTKIMHHGPTLELIISAIVKSNHVINIMTIDNKRVVNHQIDIRNADQHLITNPVPYRMNVGNGFFNAKDSELRVLSFSEDIWSNLTFSIIMKNEGGKLIKEGEKLNCSRLIEKGVRLCTSPLNLKEGNYTLIKSGGWTGTHDFIIGTKIPPFYENPPDCLPIWEWYYLFVFVSFFFIIVLFPHPSEIERALTKSSIAAYNLNSSKNERAWLGILSLHRFLFQKSELPCYLPFSISICFFYVLFLPLMFFEIDGKMAVMFSWGYICGKKVLWHFLGGEIGLRSIYFVIAPVLFLSSFLSIERFSTFSIVVSVLFELASLRGFVSLVFKLIDMSGVSSALTSPIICLNFILHLQLIRWIISYYMKRKQFAYYQSDATNIDL